MTHCAIIDYGSGNLRSVAKALEVMAPKGTTISVSSDPKDVARAQHIILPGVGAFADCYAGLTAIPDMIATLERRVLHDKIPFLGICVGMQLLATEGLENGSCPGLNWIEGTVAPITVAPGTPVPHMGWNNIEPTRNHPVLRDIQPGDHAYFVHSYGFKPTNASDILMTTSYDNPIVAMLARENIVATQFHPEKSQSLGLSLLKHFLQWEYQP